MKLILIALLLSGCAATKQECVPLPDPPDNPTKEQLAVYAQAIVGLYGDCADPRKKQ